MDTKRPKVFVDFEEYTHLLEFKKEIENERICRIRKDFNDPFGWDEIYEYLSKEDALKEVSDYNNKLERQVDTLQSEISKLKRMNCKEFKKWKRQKIENK